MAIRGTLTFLAILCVATWTGVAAAQCEPHWLPGDGIAGVLATDQALQTVGDMTVWDPDGSGPAPSRLIIGGRFEQVGASGPAQLGAWDGSGWSTLTALEPFMPPDVSLLIPWGDRLVAASLFSCYIGDGEQWTKLPGLGNTQAITVFNGDVIAGGSFSSAQGNPAISRIARWDGTAWHPLDLGLDNTVLALTVHEGALFAGGMFLNASGTPAARIARWDGSAWTPLGAGLGGAVWSLLSTPDGLVAAGMFSTAGGSPAASVARWDGQSWQPLGTKLSNVRCLAWHEGELYAGGDFKTVFPSQPVPNHVARWDGSEWVGLDQGRRLGVLAMASYAGDLVVAEANPGGSTPKLQCVYRWDGHQWSALGRGLDAPVWSLRADGNSVLAGGEFINAGSSASYRTGAWNGVGWSALGAGIGTAAPTDPLGTSIRDIMRVDDGRVIAGGNFLSAGGVPANRIAQYDAPEWSALGSGFAFGRVETLLQHGNDIIAGGSFSERVARWDGNAWQTLPGLGFGVADLCIFEDLIVAGGSMSQTSPPVASIAAWDGTQWTPIGSFPVGRSVRAVTVHQSQLIAAGEFEGGNVAAWNGAAWSPLGDGLNGIIEDLASVGGQLFAVGTFQGCIARWDGQAWQPLGTGLTEGYARAYSVSGTPHEIIVGGDFMYAGGQLSAYFARYTLTNTPWIALHPQPFTTSSTLPVTLSATPATGYDNLTFQWQRETAPGSNEWTDLSDGPGGASPNGGTVSGATGNVHGGDPALLTITNLQLSDAGNYRCVISSPCGQDESNPALLSITNPCPPDLTTTALPGTPGYGTPNGTLNNDDFFFYLAAFASGNLAVADLTTTAIPATPGYGVPNGAITNDDFFYYLILFSTGC